jgi:hypothetical protein
MITKENYELYLFDLTEGNLTAEEVKMVEDFLTLHPELKAELAAYRSAVLEADTTVVYKNKESLKRKSGGKRFYLFNPYYSAAALVTILLGAWWVLRETQQPSLSETTVAQETTVPLTEPENNVSIPEITEEHTAQMEHTIKSTTSSVRSESKYPIQQAVTHIKNQDLTAAVASNLEQVAKIDTSVIKKDVVQKQVDEQLQQRLATVAPQVPESSPVISAEQKVSEAAVQQTPSSAVASIEEPAGHKERVEEKVAGWLSYLSKPTLRIQKVKEEDKTRIRIELENQRLRLMGSMKVEL